MKSTEKEKTTIKADIIIRLRLIYLLILFVGIIVLCRIFQLQTVDSSRLDKMVVSIKQTEIEPFRGDICACDGRILATSMPSYTVHWDLTVPGLSDTLFKNNVDSLAACMSSLFQDMTKNEYAQKFRQARKEGKKYLLVKDKVTYTQIATMKQFPIFKRGRYRSGFIANQQYTRELPHKQLASRTIGYINKDNQHVGMEGAFNDILSGVKGLMLMQKLSSGDLHPVDKFGDNQIEPQDGKDVITTIDVNIQDLAEKSLLKQLSRHGAKHGSAIVMEVKTGRIRAIANLDQKKDGTYTEMYNYAIGASSEPGSTFKLASLIAVLEKGNIDITDSIDTESGEFTIGDFSIKDDHKGGYGKLNVQTAFEKSSNVGIAKLVYNTFRNNSQDFVDRLYSMHLNKRTGIEVKGEPMPDIKYPGDKYWSGVSLAQMAIGYELKITPLQTLTFYNAIANNGVMLKPTLIQEVRFHGNVEKVYDPEVINSAVCNKETLAKVKKLLEGVVENGTARNIYTPAYKIAGKTGTAQIARGQSGYKGEDGISYQASFVGYFPADNPKYSCIVVVNSPTIESYYGNVVAGTVFKDISDKLFSTDYDLQSKQFDLADFKDSKMPPFSKNGSRDALKEVFTLLNIPYTDAGNYEWVATHTTSDTVDCSVYRVRKNIVPDVRGMGLKDAVYILENLGLRVRVTGRGSIKSQSLAPGEAIKKGSVVYLQLG